MLGWLPELYDLWRSHQGLLRPAPVFVCLMPLSILERTVGQGREAATGTIVGVLYRGTLKDGTEFDASLESPLRIPLGEDALIPGFEQGLIGMKVGGKRRLEIPPELAYGDEGSPPDIPANATLVFEIELVEVSDLDY